MRTQNQIIKSTGIMKIQTALIATLSLGLSVGHATTVLINSSTRNGGFETNTSNTFATMDQWFNNPGSQTTAVRSSLSQTGSWAGIVSLASNPTISTGHLLAAGDAFTLGFGHRDDAAGGNPVINWQLFYFSDEGDIGFDPLISTARVVLSSDSVTASSTTYATAGFTPAATASGDPGIGSTVYLRFFRSTGDGQFPLIDNVTLSVIPEPSSALLGLAGLFLVFRRNRR
jgi:hypothetical protein